ncbi:MAG: biopolymer transporter ExbD [Kiritimatiellae bacterium]|nr:biopolymer transporter ExbD [Kiritimatiellia bacterium]
MSSWKWMPERTQGIWRHGALWLRPFAVAAPFLSVLLLLLQFDLVGGTFTSAKGVLFDLPAAGVPEGEKTDLVALMMVTPRETLVFFDDSRYIFGDDVSVEALGAHLAERVGKTENRTLLVLADRRTAGGDLMKFAAVARRSGVRKVLFAEKRGE